MILISSFDIRVHWNKLEVELQSLTSPITEIKRERRSHKILQRFTY